MTYGNRLMFLVVSIVMLLMTCPAAYAQNAASKPAAKKPAAIPQKNIQAMIQMLQLADDASEDFEKHYAESIGSVLALARETEKAYPDAPNLAEMYEIPLQYSSFVLNLRKDDNARQQFNNVVEHVLNSTVNLQTKAYAENVRLRLIVMGDGKLADLLPGEKPDDATALATQLIEAFVERYKDALFAVHVYVAAADVANTAKLDDLHAKYVTVLKEKYGDDKATRAYLKELSKLDNIGKPFTATLTTLDGKTLTLPDDFKGKVVVIDFWATWCGPCVQAMPDLKKFYEAYKDKDVEVIGISLDQTKGAVEKFLKGKGYDWVQTYDKGGWKTPAAVRYGINSIPAIFVVDREGNIYSIDARGNLDATVDKALQANPATRAEEKK